MACLIVGGSGRVAQRIAAQLVAKSTVVYSMIRNPEQAPYLKSLGAEPIVDSIEELSSQELAAKISSLSPKPQILIFSAGAGGKGGPSRTDAVDRVGAIKTFDAAREAGVLRLIVVSAIDVRDRANRPAPEWYDEQDMERSAAGYKAIGPYYDAKLAADRDLRTKNSERGLRYTIVRPGSLSDEEGKGRVSAGKVHISGDARKISRDDVASVVIACLNNDGTEGLAFDVVGGEGGDTNGVASIQEAVDHVAKNKIDCFEGYY